MKTRIWGERGWTYAIEEGKEDAVVKCRVDHDKSVVVREVVEVFGDLVNLDNMFKTLADNDQPSNKEHEKLDPVNFPEEVDPSKGENGDLHEDHHQNFPDLIEVPHCCIFGPELGDLISDLRVQCLQGVQEERLRQVDKYPYTDLNPIVHDLRIGH